VCWTAPICFVICAFLCKGRPFLPTPCALSAVRASHTNSVRVQALRYRVKHAVFQEEVGDRDPCAFDNVLPQRSSFLFRPSFPHSHQSTSMSTVHHPGRSSTAALMVCRLIANFAPSNNGQTPHVFFLEGLGRAIVRLCEKLVVQVQGKGYYRDLNLWKPKLLSEIRAPLGKVLSADLLASPAQISAYATQFNRNIRKVGTRFGGANPERLLPKRSRSAIQSMDLYRLSGGYSSYRCASVSEDPD
jgi:hypothetical protein